MKLLKLVPLALFLFTVFTACKDDEGTPAMENKLQANAGTDRQVEVDELVALDGSASTDGNNKPFTYLWTLKSKPTGSQSELDNETRVNADFTPDVAGAYVIELEIANGTGESTDEVTITAEIPNNSAEAIIIDGDINQDRVLTNIVAEGTAADYIVKALVNVKAKLTVEPGVVIVFEEDKGLKVTAEGKLIATGTEEEPITFTGKEHEVGYWAGIMLLSSSLDNEISNANIYYAGSTAIYPFSHTTAIGLANDGFLKLMHTNIEYASGSGLHVASGGIIDMGANSFVNNEALNIVLPVNQAHKMDSETEIVAASAAVNYVALRGDRLELEEEVTWKKLSNNAYYHVVDEVSVLSGLRIQEGAELRFNANEFFKVLSTGYLYAKGTQANPIRFDIDVQTGANWGGLLFKSPSNENLLEWVEIRHGGTGTPAYGMGKSAAISVDNDLGAKLSMKNSTVFNSKTYGLYVEKGAYLGEFSSNNFEANAGTALALPIYEAGKLTASSVRTSENGQNAVEIVESTLNLEQEISLTPMADGTTYFMPQGIEILSGLKIQPGVSIAFGQHALIKVAGGYLNAVGTPEANITFTGAVKEKGYWMGIVFKTSSTQNVMDYTEVSYGGSANMPGMVNTKANIAVDADQKGRLMVTNSKIKDGAGWGVAVETGYGATINTDAETSNTFEALTSGSVYKY